MPIERPLPDRWPRRADRAAIEFVPEKRSSVFLTFPRGVYEAEPFSAATKLAKELVGKGISQQG